MLTWIAGNKILLTALVAMAGFLLSLFNTYRNYSIKRPKIKIKPTPLSVAIKNFSSKPDTIKYYFHFEIINKSIFPVTLKAIGVQVRGQWCNATLLKSENSSLPIRIEARDVESFGLQGSQEDIASKDIQMVRVSLSDDKTFCLSGRRIQKLLET